LVGAGGWRLPFAVVGTAALVVCVLCGVWCPPAARQPGPALAFFAHDREAGADRTVWSVLAANALQQLVLFGVFGSLAAHLMSTARMTARATRLPLALAGAGLIAAGYLGGRVAPARRLVWFADARLGSGLLAALVFTPWVSPWAAVALAFG
jgi:DHA1 family inner membrane transport protein